MSEARETLVLRAGSERWADTLVDVSPLDVLASEALPAEELPAEELPAEELRAEELPQTAHSTPPPSVDPTQSGWRVPLVLFALAMALFGWGLWSALCREADGVAAPAEPAAEPARSQEGYAVERTPVVRPLEVNQEAELSKQGRSLQSARPSRSQPPSRSLSDARAAAARALFEGRLRDGARLYRALPEGALEPELRELLLQLLEGSVEP